MIKFGSPIDLNGVTVRSQMNKTRLTTGFVNHNLVFSVSMCTESQPEVIHCLRLALMDAVKDTVQQVISVLRCGRNHETDLNKPRVPDHLLQSLPREWGYIPRESRRKEPSKGEHISSLRKCPLKKQALGLFSYIKF